MRAQLKFVLDALPSQRFSSWCFFYSINFQDSNNIQEFEFEELEDFEELQLVFNSSSDFYGRVIIYQLSLIGS